MIPIGLVVFGAVAVGGLVALDRIASRVVRPVPAAGDGEVPDTGVERESLSIASGNHVLAAWLLGTAHGDGPLVLMAHGWGASHETVLRLADPLARSGHQVLLFDVRGHGRNEEAPFVTVRHFRDDVMAVVRQAGRRFPGRRLVLVGHSFGGAAGVLAAAEGAEIHALILIATPSDVVRITAEYLTDKGMPGGLMVKVLRPFWWRRLGGTFGPHTPVRRIREIDVPLLLIQPEHDERVTREHAEQLSAAAGVPYHLIPGRGHTNVLEAGMTIELVEDFLASLERMPATSDGA